MTSVGARWPRIDLNGCSIIVGMSQSTGLRRKAAWGKEEMSQGALRHSKWEREPNARERERERERVNSHRGNF